jgi:uncharacterized protein YeaO (DUF488 family)
MRSVHTFQIGSPRKSSDGVRIAPVRYLPRGVFKKDYARQDYFDVWLPTLAPSRALMQWVRKREWNADTRKTFFDRYKSEMKSTNGKQTIQLLATLGKRTAISIGCYCSDESFCHRSVLRRLIASAKVT